MTPSRVPRAATSCAVVVLAGLTLAVAGGCSRPANEADPPAVPLGAIDQIYAEMGGDISIEQARADGLHEQELVAECMAERGFEYTPVEPNIVDGQAMAEDWDAMPGTLEFAEKYGYGYASGFWDEQDATSDDADPAPDPNYARYAAMSTAEAEEYAAALWGEAAMTDAVPDADGAVTGYDWEANGCEGWAQHEMDALPDGLDPDAFAALDAETTAMYGALSTAPEQAELDAAWAQCMTEAGYPDFDVRVDAEDSALGAREATRERAYATVPPLPTDAQRRAAEESTTGELADLLPQEIELAVADITCRQDVAYTETQQQISIDAQQEFYDAHKAELDAWIEAYQEAQQ